MLRTLLVASLAGGASATILGVVAWVVMFRMDPASPISAATIAWTIAFVFMTLTVVLIPVALLLSAILVVTNRFKPSLLAGQMFPTLICVTLGAAAAVGLLYILTLGIAGDRMHWAMSRETGVIMLATTVGGAVTGAIVARRSAGTSTGTAKPTLIQRSRP
jgi:hypothetical protein